MRVAIRPWAGCLLAVALVAARAPSVWGAVVLDEGDVDIAVGYEDGAWDLHVHDEQNDTEYDPGAVWLLIGVLDPPATQPAGAEWEFIGAGAGNEYFLSANSPWPGMLFLGFGAEEIDAGTLQTYFEPDPRVGAAAEWIRLSLVDVRGPGEFSAWTTDPFGGPAVWLSTYEGGVTAADAIFLRAGAHEHYNLGFTAPGLYEIDFAASAYLPDGTPVASNPVTFHFAVTAVPEPTAWLLASLAALGCVAATRARSRFSMRPPTIGAGLALIAIASLGSTRSSAQVPEFTDALVQGHVDGFALGFGSSWTFGIDDKSANPPVSYSPDTTILVARPEARVNRPAGSQWDFLGAAAGQPLWVLPQSSAASVLFLGTNGEGIPAGTLAPYSETDPRVTGLPASWVTLQVVDARGPGAFSIWTSGSGTTVWVSTADGGLNAADKLLFLEGGHTHWNWGFTDRGVYEIDVVASGRLNDGLGTIVTSDVRTYYFGVETSKAGDANLDGRVDGADFTIWADGFGDPDPLFTDADFNGDGQVDGGDFTLWADGFDEISAAAVPEPGGLALAACAIAAGAWSARRKSLRALVGIAGVDLRS